MDKKAPGCLQQLLFYSGLVVLWKAGVPFLLCALAVVLVIFVPSLRSVVEAWKTRKPEVAAKEKVWMPYPRDRHDPFEEGGEYSGTSTDDPDLI